LLPGDGIFDHSIGHRKRVPGQACEERAIPRRALPSLGTAAFRYLRLMSVSGPSLK
jgi:hypothetical protein